MTQNSSPVWDPSAARKAGALYLSIAVFGGFSIGYVPLQIVVSGDAVQSSANLLAHQGLFKLGVLADSAVILFELAITVLLYDLFRSVGPRMAMLAALSRAGMIMVMGINLLFWIMPYILLTNASAFDPGQLNALAMMFFDAHAMGVFVWQLFFGAHLLALGWLILQTRHVPPVLGYGLFVGAFGYLLQGLAELAFVDVVALDIFVIALLVIVTLSELSFGLWLLIWGGRASLKSVRHAPAFS